MRVRACVRVCGCVRVRVRACVPAPARARVRACVRLCACVCVRACVCVCVCARARACVLACVRAYFNVRFSLKLFWRGQMGRKMPAKFKPPTTLSQQRANGIGGRSSCVLLTLTKRPRYGLAGKRKTSIRFRASALLSLQMLWFVDTVLTVLYLTVALIAAHLLCWNHCGVDSVDSVRYLQFDLSLPPPPGISIPVRTSPETNSLLNECPER